MSDIQEEQKRLYKKAKNNDKRLNEKKKISKMTKVEIAEKYNKLVEQYNRVNERSTIMFNVILNIDFQCHCAKLKTPTIKQIDKLIEDDFWEGLYKNGEKSNTTAIKNL